jgi:hypothetical protein
MGLGFSTRASLKRKRLFGSASIASMKEVADAILHCTHKTPLEPLASLVGHDSDGSYALNRFMA